MNIDINLMGKTIVVVVACLIAFLLLKMNLNALEIEQNVSKQEKLTHLLSDLVSLKTLSSDPDANLKALNWVEKQLSHQNGLHFNYHQYKGYHALVITTHKTKKPRVWLVSHIDVVSGAEALFHPVVRDHKMYGRGAYDMKMAIACYILLLQELNDQLKSYDFGVMLTSDEEIGGMNGVKCLLEEGYSSEVALLPDGGFDWNFEEAAKGVMHIKIMSQGRSAHSSRPWSGENAIEKLMVTLQDIQRYFAHEKTKNPNYFPTGNIGIIQGGDVINQVPDYAEAKIDIRYPPTMNSEEVFESLKEVGKKQDNITLEKMIEGSPHQVDLKSEFFQKFSHLAHQMYGIEVGVTKSHGSSDARFFGEQKIPVLVIAPKGGEIHSENEWIDLEDLVRFYEVMKAWVLQMSLL